ncbi:NmrA/HSCARG family protein [Kribbella qitaiheensis]|uniref:NmrA/HSCARG family protein n=1 Tax=Kribbella qitaiheensis TaxID=1544730 RepID=A0A7G6X495_9ACTN|nr:NmrA/HSCARG family protein [Kribbella qitaiheensis]QNE21060.1 NmrA/HSCARG family protein [Kribbella qitaiheensis]
MTDKKLIAVVGATGSQGGGLVRAILVDPDATYAVRAVTRNAQSRSAKALAAAGAEVVEADLDDETSLRKAFDGAHGAFVVTNYWVERTPAEEAARTRGQMEYEQAENAARAAKDAGVAHVVWSTLEDTRPHFGDTDRVPSLDGGRYKVPHFDAKGEANELFTKYGVPTTNLQTTFYFDSLKQGMGPARDADGKLILTLPMADQPLSGIASEDIGRTALGIFKRGAELIGKTVSIAGDHLTGTEYAAALTEALGEQVTYQPYTWDEYRALGFPLAVEIANMFQFYAEDSARFTGDRDLNLVRELNPDLQSFTTWLNLHKDALKSAAN